MVMLAGSSTGGSVATPEAASAFASWYTQRKSQYPTLGSDPLNSPFVSDHCTWVAFWISVNTPSLTTEPLGSLKEPPEVNELGLTGQKIWSWTARPFKRS